MPSTIPTRMLTTTSDRRRRTPFFLTVTVILIIQVALAPRAFSSAGQLDTSFGGDGKVTTGLRALLGAARSTAIQPDGKIVAAGVGIIRLNVDGTPDSTFGHDGVVPTAFKPGGYPPGAYAMALQDDGKIVVAGTTAVAGGGGSQFALARYNPDGTLDSTFGGVGEVITHFASGSYDRANGMAIQGDGRIVLVGTSLFHFHEHFALARYTSNGSLDTSFGGDGKVITHFASGSEDVANAVAIQKDGRIVAAGVSYPPGPSSFALARYSPDGSLDTSFGGDGTVTTRFATPSTFSGDFARAVAIQGNGDIVAAGSSKVSVDQFALARYLSDGSLDASFGGDGRVTTQFAPGANAGGNAVAIQQDGAIVAAGATTTYVGSDGFALARYLPDGGLDSSFGGTGKVTTGRRVPVGASAADMVIQADGKVVVVGNGFLVRYTQDGTRDPGFGTGGEIVGAFGAAAVGLQGNRIIVAGEAPDFSGVRLARFNPDGTLDTTFGHHGFVTTRFDCVCAEVTDVAVQKNGKIVLVGYLGGEEGESDTDLLVVRYDAGGTLDSTFGTGGKVSVERVGTSYESSGYAVVIQNDGKILAAGGSGSGKLLVRFNSDGSRDRTFGIRGKVTTGLGGWESVALQSDGKIVAAGQSNGQFELARFKPNGHFDTSFGGDGKVRTRFADGKPAAAHAVAVQANGRIVAAGDANRRFALARYGRRGRLDGSFGGDGRVLTHFSRSSADSAVAVSIQTDGKIVAAGSTKGKRFRIAVARYLAA